MSVVLVHREYPSSTGTLVSVAQRLLGALNEKAIGAQVVVNLSPAFVADFTAQVALVAKLGAEQSGAIGSLGTLVKTQAELLAEFRHQASVLRRAARLAFPRNGTLLRGEFQVGVAVARDMPRIMERGRNLLAACERYAVDLASCGWSTSSTEAFSDTVASLAELNRQRELVADEKLGLTAERVVATNRLYRQCLMVQNVARLLYDGSRTSEDTALVEPRARFLLGEFPRWRSPIASLQPQGVGGGATQAYTPLADDTA